MRVESIFKAISTFKKDKESDERYNESCCHKFDHVFVKDISGRYFIYCDIKIPVCKRHAQVGY